MSVEWTYKGRPVPDKKPQYYGYCYLIEYDDNTLYVGKKSFYSTRTMKPLKSDKNREGGTFFNKIVNRKITKFESVKSESNWRKYSGSSKKTKSMKIKSKTMLQVYPTKLDLTFGEIEYMVKLDVLRNDMYHNDNCLGKFFKGKINKEII